MYALGDGEQLSPFGNQSDLRRQRNAVIGMPPAGTFGDPAASAAAVSLLNFRHPANVVSSFSHVQTFAAGVSLLVIGTLCVAFNIVNICFIDQVGWVVYVTGNGFWAGCACLASGGFCVAASRNKTRLLIACCVVADILTSFLALQQLIVGVRGAVWATHLCTYQRLLNEDDNCHVGRVTTAMEASLAAVAILAIVAAVWSLVIACRALGCCAQVSVSQFGDRSSRDVFASSLPAGQTTSVVYRPGSDDVIASTSSPADRTDSRYAALY